MENSGGFLRMISILEEDWSSPMDSKRPHAIAGTVATLIVSSAVLAGGVIHDVTQFDVSFVPADIKVNPGDIIQWHWTQKEHTVTFGSDCSPGGEAYDFNENLDDTNPTVEWNVPEDAKPGVINYYCEPHCVLFDMIGTITVLELSVPCPEDLDGSSEVGFADLLQLLAGWGPCARGGCAADLDGSGDIGFADLLQLLAAWGPCG